MTFLLLVIILIGIAMTLLAAVIETKEQRTLEREVMRNLESFND